MTVRELQAILAKCNPNDIIVLSSDGEGNGYEMCYTVSTKYNYDSANKEIGLRQLTPEDIKLGYSDEDVNEGGVACVVLWP